MFYVDAHRRDVIATVNMAINKVLIEDMRTPWNGERGLVVEEHERERDWTSPGNIFSGLFGQKPWTLI